MFKGEVLKNLRIENEKKQEDVAKYLGITQGSLGHFEAGRRQPKRDIILKLCEFFNVEESVFYGEEKEVDKVRELIDELIEQNVIKDPDNIPEDVVKLIMDAIRMEIRLQKIKKEQ